MKQIEVVAAVIRKEDKIFARKIIKSASASTGSERGWCNGIAPKRKKTRKHCAEAEEGKETRNRNGREETLESIDFTLNHIWLQDHQVNITLKCAEQNEEDSHMPMAAETED